MWFTCVPVFSHAPGTSTPDPSQRTNRKGCFHIHWPLALSEITITVSRRRQHALQVTTFNWHLWMEGRTPNCPFTFMFRSSALWYRDLLGDRQRFGRTVPTMRPVEGSWSTQFHNPDHNTYKHHRRGDLKLLLSSRVSRTFSDYALFWDVMRCSSVQVNRYTASIFRVEM
jgi:hypothetical protein